MIQENNPFAPPQAAVADLRPAEAAGPTPWFAVSVTKLLVMSMCTLTLYQIYWFYQQWVRVKRREGSGIMPAARAIFAVFFVYSLFGKVRRGVAPAAAPGLSAGPLAAGWIVTALTWRAPGAWGLAALAGVLFMLPVQAAMNLQNESLAPGAGRNERFSLWNWLAIVPGGAMLVLAVIGSLLPQA